jgi:preprotein translocase subunit SecG
MLSSILSVLLSIVSIVSAFLLIGIILIQQSKSGGGLGAVSGGMTESMFGASAGNVLTKATTWIAAVFLLSTLFLATVVGRMRNDVSAAELIPQAVSIETDAPAVHAETEAAPAEDAAAAAGNAPAAADTAAEEPAPAAAEDNE